jgi:osmotically inducible protein OsmC
MSVRHAEAEWKGDLKGGNGHVKFGSGAYEGAYSFHSRFENGRGANPEEMIGSAYAGCFAMALANTFAQGGHVANSVHAKADVHLGKDDKGFLITHIELTVNADVPGLDADTFHEHVQKLSQGCIVARALGAVKKTVLSAHLK